MGKNPYAKVILCEDCSFSFQVYAPPKRHKRYYCPSCGENFSTVSYKPELTSENKNAKIRWTNEEKELLQKVKTNELAPYQVAIMTGRSINSVAKKLKRI